MPVGARPPIRLPSDGGSPLGRLSLRIAVAVALILLVAAVAYIEREGYRDGDKLGTLTVLDAIYYATVSVTTTGYGDITPVSESARFTNILLVTPARILFLILLVGTTVEALAGSSTEAFRQRLWRKRLHDHTIVCGFGTKGRNAIETLRARGVEDRQIVVVDDNADAVEEASRAGFAVVHGSSTRLAVLEEAGVREAASIIVAPDNDAAAVLTTLTAREHNKTAMIVAAVRETENRHLLHESGANSAIVTSSAAGRLLGFATHSPRIVEVLEDLLSVGSGLDIVERIVAPEHDGRPLSEMVGDAPVIGVERGDQFMRFDDPAAHTVRAGDKLVCFCSNEKDAA
ncbi:MAG: Potassium channel protein [uncultured Solirubrobacteraceae bacterium]|uniref:Potassium channel protein n=1 Tax=uncultured Solirubrobacteraceae bacterium TaxID=1162706 RepID=A0A6J4THX3_9ACTN|nr:MAG: Potassium channel protein [uncultured Solirubrobacteraceae bacterium]